MSVQPATDFDDNKVVEMTETPGRRLRAARQRYGLDLERVAAELHLKPAAIAAIEHDDYQALPGSVFTAGYMRNYARLLNMDPEPVLAAYRAVAHTEPSPAARPAVPPRAGSNGQGMAVVRTAALVLLVALAALAVIWWQTRSPVPEVSTPTEPPRAVANMAEQDSVQTKPVAATRAPQARAGAGVESPPQPTTPPQTTETVEPAGVKPATREATPPPAALAAGQTRGESAGATAPATSLPAKTSPAAAAETAKGVVMEFSGPCWVDIRGSDRSYKLLGEMHEGDRRVLEGRPPYSVILGNAAAVKVTVNGSQFDLKRFTRGNVARFKLDPDHLP
jgi:cytoskeleton protein RodZ